MNFCPALYVILFVSQRVKSVYPSSLVKQQIAALVSAKVRQFVSLDRSVTLKPEISPTLVFCASRSGLEIMAVVNPQSIIALILQAEFRPVLRLQ